MFRLSMILFFAATASLMATTEEVAEGLPVHNRNAERLRARHDVNQRYNNYQGGGTVAPVVAPVAYPVQGTTPTTIPTQTTLPSSQYQTRPVQSTSLPTNQVRQN